MNNDKFEMDKFIIVSIYGSPRRNGNTETLLDRFLEGLGENKVKGIKNVIIEKIYASKLNISPCRECCNCSENGECIIDDEMQDVYKKLIRSDFIAVSSPIFFTSVSGYLKALIDRCQRFWALKYELKKKIFQEKRKGIFISTAGSNSVEIFDCAKRVIKSFFDVLNVEYYSDFLFNGVDKKGDILKNKDALKSLYQFGRNTTLC